MALITSVRTKIKEDGSSLGIFRLEGQDATVFLTGKQIQSATGLKNNFSVLKGSDLTVEYFKEGDELISGAKCTKDNSIVKEFSFELESSLAKIAGAVALGASLF